MNAKESEATARKSAYFTLSLLIDREQINALLRDCWPSGPRTVWNQFLLQRVQARYAESGALHAAINPMFDDIADRARNLFLRDFLLDTPNQWTPDEGEVDESLRNVCARLSLELPQPIHWRTEGRPVQTVDLGAQPIRFDGVLCRAFWMAHSNEALSYHLSLEVPYHADMAQYFGLSMLQKLFFNSEHTEWLLDEPGQGWQAQPASGTTAPLLAYVEVLFEAHVQHLLSAIGKIDRGQPDVPKGIGAGAWQRLILRQPSRPMTGTSAKAWADVARHRRLLVVLRDATFFDTLELARRIDSNLLPYEPFAPSTRWNGWDRYELDHLARAIETQVRAHPAHRELGATDLARAVERYTMALFLSGFLQNIVDFLQQDGLEVHDGLMPIYPPPGDTGANDGFMLYATPSVVVEVVRTSRSLDGAGRQWIGTCPYVFLVHMTAFHNESLVLAYEDNVSRLVGHLQAQGLRSDADAASENFEPVLEHAFECIRDFRLVTFEQVHKHYSFNVFRYDTEQTFFQSIEKVRGVVPRREYWDGVLSHLTETVDGLKADREARFERRVSGFGLVLTALGVVQLWFTVFALDTSMWSGWSRWANGVALPMLGIFLLFRYGRFIPSKTRLKRADSWRLHGATGFGPATPPAGAGPLNVSR